MVSIGVWLTDLICLCKQVFSAKQKKALASILFLVGGFALASNENQWQAMELKVEDGLPDSTVYSMAQDAAGFMWFGTTNGLARYDGYSFKVFRHDGTDQNTLSNNNSGNIHLDSNNRLWIGTFGGGANVMNLDDGSVKRFPYSSNHDEEKISENVQTFFEDSKGRIWIGTGTGLYQYENETLKYFGQADKSPNSLNQSRVWDIEEDSQGNIWQGTSDGLSQLDIDTGRYTQFRLPDELAINISSNQFRTLEMIDDVLWIGSSTGLFSFYIKSKKFEFYPANQKSIKINDLHIEGNEMIIASMEGIYQFNLEDKKFKLKDNGQLWQYFNHLDVRQLKRDRSGLLWLATRDNGVAKVDQEGGIFQLHTDYIKDNDWSEKSKQVWTVSTDASNHVLIGTSDTLFKRSPAGEADRVTVAGMDQIPGIIRTIKPKLNGGYWVGGSDGLFYLPANGLVADVLSEPFVQVGLEPTDVFSVTETLNGDVWLALYNVGVLRWNPAENEAELIQSIGGHSLADLNISVVYADSHQHIWIGSNLAGVFRFNPENQQIDFFNHEYGDSLSISSNRIKDVFQDSLGRMWVGTARGLNLFNSETQQFTQYTQTDGLINDSINSIHEDSHQNLWLISDFGISRFVPEKQEINNYLLNEAISNDGFGNRASVIDNKDVIYIGSVNGVYSFDPKALQISSQYKPPLKMTQTWVNNQPVNFSEKLGDEIEFDLYHGDRKIAFEFAALDFKSPEQIKYRYRILGMNEEWLNISSNRQIELNNLNPGSYQVEVKAINNDGRWSEQFMSISLKIHPVWWNRGWVKGLFGLFLIILALSFHQFRTHKIRKQNLLLEDEVKNRTSELHDLNQQLKTAAHSDFLTHLPNRLAFIKSFDEKGHESNDRPGCLVMADIDHFKQINDQHGHAAGDLILIKVSGIMHSMIRQEDLIARWGGEEFVFYFEDKTSQQILPMINRIRETIELAEFKYADTMIPVTLTFGICQKENGMSLNDCINKADEAMYEGKAQGRNAVKVA